jgi:uncharacterized protein YkwD
VFSTVLRKGPGVATVLALVALALLLVPTASYARPANPAKKAKASQSCANTDLRPSRANLELVRDAILCLHNRERVSRGLPRLKENPKLRRAAERHSNNMVAGSFFDHTSPSGGTMVDRVRGSGYTSRARSWSLGENIAWGSGRLATAQQIHRSWMNSSGHRANILRRSFREIGIGIETGLPVRLSAAQSGATYTTDFGFRR